MSFYLYMLLALLVAGVAAYFYATNVGGVTRYVAYWRGREYLSYLCWLLVFYVGFLVVVYLKWLGFFAWVRGVGCDQ